MNFVHVCMRTYDKQLKGNINFDDFIQCCVLLKTLTEQFRAKDTQQSGVVKIQYEEVCYQHLLPITLNRIKYFIVFGDITVRVILINIYVL